MHVHMSVQEIPMELHEQRLLTHLVVLHPHPDFVSNSGGAEGFVIHFIVMPVSSTIHP